MRAVPDDQIRGLRRVYVLMGVADGTLLPFIPLYLLQRGMRPAAIGLVLAGSALAALAGGLGWAYLADRRLSPERLVLTATFVAAAFALLMVVPGSAGSWSLPSRGLRSRSSTRSRCAAFAAPVAPTTPASAFA